MKLNKYIVETELKENSADELLLNETLFHNANGYVGLRGAYEEGYPQNYKTVNGTYINGFYDRIAMPQAEKLYGFVTEKDTIVNIANVQGMKIFLDDEEFLTFEGKCERNKRSVDMENGYTARDVHWVSNKGKEIEFLSKRMTSFTRLPLILMEYQIKSMNYTGVVTLQSSINGDVTNFCDEDDPRVGDSAEKCMTPLTTVVENSVSKLLTSTSNTNMIASILMKHDVDKYFESQHKIEDTAITETVTVSINEGETIKISKYVVVTDSIRCLNAEDTGSEMLDTILRMPIEELWSEQKRYLSNYWNHSAININGDEEMSQALIYNQYQLLQSVGKDEFSNIAAKGLSGEGYEGHYFWDSEMYIQPYFVMTQPELAKNLIRFRYHSIDKARENAKILGHDKGVLFPWRTIGGTECSGYYVSGTAQYHINSDVAYSVVQYFNATNDIDFLVECGAAILIETARTWIDLGNLVNDEFHLPCVTGPDEYTCMVDDNYFTNVSAKHNLTWAVKTIKILKSCDKANKIMEELHISDEELQKFEEIASKMYIPYDEKLNINPQDNSFLSKQKWDLNDIDESKNPLLLHYHPLYLYRKQICKQADVVLSHFVHEDDVTEDVMRDSFWYYDKITTHDSSLSTCIFSIVASKLGEVDKAYEYFGDSAKLDLMNLHNNTKDGIHTANMGGCYMAVVYGFAGVRIKEDRMVFNPYLPKMWTDYSFRLQYRGSTLEVAIDEMKTNIKLIKGDSVKIELNGEVLLLKDEIMKNNMTY